MIIAFDQRVFQSSVLQWRLLNSHFADLSRQEIASLVEEKVSKNTQSVTKTALSTLKAFCGEKYPDKVQNFDKTSKEEPNELLADFYPNARKKTGENYKKTALTSIRFGLQRYFNRIRGFNISMPTVLLNSLTKSLKQFWFNLNDKGLPKSIIMNQ